MEEHFDLNRVMLARVSAPAHASRRVQDLLGRRIPLLVPKGIWSPNSHGHDPRDFWIWGVIEGKSNSQSSVSDTDLKKAYKKAASIIHPEEAQRACAAFRGRMERVLGANGGHVA